MAYVIHIEYTVRINSHRIVRVSPIGLYQIRYVLYLRLLGEQSIAKLVEAASMEG
jgi:hypothetical protein